jgi:hypothetical protein
MTAEIAILNKHGVALSADSAVSIGSKKVYNSANKLFAMSCSQPVGVMIYGNAQFMGIPWETIIKYYRSRYLTTRCFAHLEDYADDFQKFLTETDLFAPEHEALFVRQQAHFLSYKLLEGIKKRVATHIDLHGSIDPLGTAACVSAEITSKVAELKGLDSHVTFTAAVRKAILTRHKTAIQGIVRMAVENLPLIKKEEEAFVGAIIHSLGKIKSWGGVTGVVVAGFGEMDIYPSVTDMSIEGRAEGFLKVTRSGTTKVDLNSKAIIKPFAQREMVDTFMRGMDPSFFGTLHSALKLILHKVPERLATNHGVALPKGSEDKIRADLDQLLESFTREIQLVQKQSFVDPVLDSVESLPLDELAAMAEALVNLTSFKRRVTMVPESVGGPIDVAVISKGDGFIWIKRKHYFTSDLNHHFFER